MCAATPPKCFRLTIEARRRVSSPSREPGKRVRRVSATTMPRTASPRNSSCSLSAVGSARESGVVSEERERCVSARLSNSGAAKVWPRRLVGASGFAVARFVGRRVIVLPLYSFSDGFSTGLARKSGMDPFLALALPKGLGGRVPERRSGGRQVGPLGWKVVWSAHVFLHPAMCGLLRELGAEEREKPNVSP